MKTGYEGEAGIAAVRVTTRAYAMVLYAWRMVLKIPADVVVLAVRNARAPIPGLQGRVDRVKPRDDLADRGGAARGRPGDTTSAAPFCSAVAFYQHQRAIRAHPAAE